MKKQKGFTLIELLVVIAMIALLMGIPFPVGLRLLVCSPRYRAYGWAANGVASVVSSILAIPLAMIWGIRCLLLLAASCYGVMLGAAVLAGGSAASQRLNRRTRNPHLSRPTENQGT